jgi:hypothetical protein
MAENHVFMGINMGIYASDIDDSGLWGCKVTTIQRKMVANVGYGYLCFDGGGDD